MKFKKLIVCCLAFTTLLCLGIATSLNVNYTHVKAEHYNISDELPELNKTYLKNDVLSGLPNALTVEYNGQQYLAKDAVVVFPNGISYKIEEGKNIDLSIAGTYTIKYFYSGSDISLVAQKVFVVSNNYFEMVGAGGSIKYSDENTKLESKPNGDGVIVNVDPASEFVFNKVINVYDNTVNGEKELISLSPRNVNLYADDVPNVNDATTTHKSKFILVRLTDCYDQTNYIEFRLYRATQWGAPCYISVGTAQLPYTAVLDVGSKFGSGKEAVYNGGSVWVMQDAVYGIGGYPGISAGAGHPSNDSTFKAQNPEITLKFNPMTNEVFANSSSKKSKITELDSLDIYGTDNASKVFKGFTTGEVVLSITADSFSETLSTAEIFSIDGISGADLVALASQEYNDTTKPVINVDCYKTNDTGFNVGLGQTVVIPQASAYDVNLNGGVSYYVKDALGNNVTIFDGNKFVCQDATSYTIYYEAVDKFGNKSEPTTLTVSVNNNAKGYSIGIGDSLGQTFKDIEKISDSTNSGKLLAGKTYTLPEVDFKSLNVNLGYTCKLVNENETIYLDDSLTFIPNYEGTYKVVYTLTDNVFTHTLEYEVECTRSNLVAFTTTPSINRYIVKNQKYYLTAVYATVYTNGVPEKVDADVYVVYLDSEYNEIGSAVLVSDYKKCEFAAPNDAKFVKVRYVKNDATIETNVAKLIDVSYDGTTGTGFEMRKYFDYEETFDCVYEQDTPFGVYDIPQIKYDSKITEGTNTLSFINPVVLKFFKLQYNIPLSESNFTAVELKFTDTFDKSKVVSIKIQKEGDATFVYVNDANRTLLKSTSFAGRDINILYDHYYRRLQVDDTKITINLGNVSYCDFDINLLGIFGKSSIQINSIGNQSLDNGTREDYFAPIGYNEYTMGEFSKGEIVEVSAGQYYDILRQIDYNRYEMSIRYEDPDVPFTDINGNPVNKIKDPNAVVKLKLDHYGKYTVTTTIYDFDGTVMYNDRYFFYCVDKEAPTIVLGNNYTEDTVVRIKAGQKLSVYYSVYDNHSQEDKIKVLIQVYETSLGYKLYFKPGENSMYLRHRGEFLVYVTAQDEAGNFTSKTYKVISE